MFLNAIKLKYNFANLPLLNFFNIYFKNLIVKILNVYKC